MKVRAKEHGQYKGRMYERGEVFEIENGTYPVFEVDSNSVIVKDKNGKPVVRENRPHLERWMEEINESPAKAKGPVPEAKPSSDKRSEPRDFGEHEQRVAESLGLADRP